MTSDEAIDMAVAAGRIHELFSYSGRYMFGSVGSKGYAYIHPSSVLIQQYYPNNLLVIGTPYTTQSKTRYGDLVDKTYLRNAQKIKPEWLKEIAPHLLDYGERRTVLEDGVPITASHVTLKGNYNVLFEEKTPCTPEEARELIFEQVIMPYARNKNHDLIMRLGTLSDRAADPSIQLTDDILLGLVRREASSFESAQAFYDAIDTGAVRIAFNIHDVVNEEHLQRIEEQFPLHMVLAGKERAIEYSSYGGYSATIRLDNEDEVLLLDALPFHDRRIYLRTPNNTYGVGMGEDIDAIKEQIITHQYESILAKRNQEERYEALIWTNLEDIKPLVEEQQLECNGRTIPIFPYIIAQRSYNSLERPILYRQYSLSSEDAQRRNAEPLAILTDYWRATQEHSEKVVLAKTLFNNRDALFARYQGVVENITDGRAAYQGEALSWIEKTLTGFSIDANSSPYQFQRISNDLEKVTTLLDALEQSIGTREQKGIKASEGLQKAWCINPERTAEDILIATKLLDEIHALQKRMNKPHREGDEQDMYSMLMGGWSVGYGRARRASALQQLGITMVDSRGERLGFDPNMLEFYLQGIYGDPYADDTPDQVEEIEAQHIDEEDDASKEAPLRGKFRKEGNNWRYITSEDGTTYIYVITDWNGKESNIEGNTITSNFEALERLPGQKANQIVWSVRLLSEQESPSESPTQKVVDNNTPLSMDDIVGLMQQFGKKN